MSKKSEGIIIRTRSKLTQERDQLLKTAESAEAVSNYQEAVSNYQLAAKISKEIGEYETARKALERANELKRRLHTLRRKTLETRKIRIDETRLLELNQEANEALEIATIAEEEHRWTDALKFYESIVQKNYEMGDIERARAFEDKVTKIKLILNKKL